MHKISTCIYTELKAAQHAKWNLLPAAFHLLHMPIYLMGQLSHLTSGSLLSTSTGTGRPTRCSDQYRKSHHESVHAYDCSIPASSPPCTCIGKRFVSWNIIFSTYGSILTINWDRETSDQTKLGSGSDFKVPSSNTTSIIRSKTPGVELQILWLETRCANDSIFDSPRSCVRANRKKRSSTWWEFNTWKIGVSRTTEC